MKKIIKIDYSDFILEYTYRFEIFVCSKEKQNMTGLIFPIIFFIILNSSVCVVSKEKFGTTLPFTFIFSALMIYISQYIFGTYNVGLVILVIGAVSVIPLWIISFRKGDIDYSFISGSLLSNGFIAFICIALVFGIIDYNSAFGKWDELSHWGVMVKEMLRLDSFYSVDASSLNWHKEYPPVIQCWEYLWVRLSLVYSETAMRMAIHVLTLVLPVTWAVDNADIITNVLATFMLVIAVILTINAFDGEGVFITVYQDFCYPMFYIYAMLLIITGRIWKSGLAVISAISSMAALMISKQMGVAFYGILIWTLIGSYIIEGIHSQNRKYGLKVIGGAVIVPVIFFYSWKRYTDALGLVGQFDLGDISVNGVISSLTGAVQDEGYEISRVYLDYLIHKSLFIGRFNITYLMIFILMVISIVAVAIIYSSKRKRVLLLGSALVVGTLGYAFTMLILYMYCYPGEAYAVCYERYLGTYVISELVLILLLVYMNVGNINITVKGHGIRGWALLVTVIALIVLSDKEQLLNLKPSVMRSHKSASRYARMADKLSDYAEAGSTILIIDDNAGYKRNYIHYYLNDRYYDISCTDAYNMDLSDTTNLELIMSSLQADDYLYVIDVSDSFNAVISEYTDENEIVEKGIYKIQNVDGSINLYKMN